MNAEHCGTVELWNRCGGTLTDCINVFHVEVARRGNRWDEVGLGWGRRLAVAAPELQTYKVSQCESEPTSFPSTPFVLASQAPRPDFPPDLFSDFTFSLSGLEVARNGNYGLKMGKK